MTDVAEPEELSPWKRERQNIQRVHEEKRAAVLRAAALEFRTKGPANTSLDDVAARLGVTKPTLYRYIADRDDLIFACSQQVFDDLRLDYDAPEFEGVSGLERLKDFMRRYIDIMCGDFGYCLVMIDGDHLSPARAESLRRRKREYNGQIVKLVELGMSDGSIRDCDPTLSVFALFGALNWIARWHKAASPPPDRIYEEFSQLFEAGLGAR